VEPQKLMAEAQRQGAQITTVLTTHSHYDHAGGNNAFKKLMPELTIYAGKGDNAEAAMVEVGDGDSVQVGVLEFQVLQTPCHTVGHVCYYLQTADAKCVFTGDTLFVAGVGNFFAGTPSMMHASLKKLAALPDDTLVYVGHEYSVSNLQYAAFLEPKNPHVAEKLAWAKDVCAKKQHTTPSSIGGEKLYNPFLRAVFGEPSVMQHCQTSDTVAALKFVREEKSAGAWKSHI